MGGPARLRHRPPVRRKIGDRKTERFALVPRPATDDFQQTNPTAYIETSVVNHLTAHPSRNVVVAAYQEVTREWWRDAAARFQLVVSELVRAECSAGDPTAARARLQVLEGVTLLDATRDAEHLVNRLIDLGAVRRDAVVDAAHIAIAVTNGVEYLVTWNLRHIANAAMREQRSNGHAGRRVTNRP